MRLKSWESPRRQGRNDKGKGGSASSLRASTFLWKGGTLQRAPDKLKNSSSDCGKNSKKTTKRKRIDKIAT
ncbi:MAG: hypothetical protein ACFB4I_03350 [Cyanophyceae cyanobacterium]